MRRLNPDTVGVRLRQARKGAGMTQAELAERAGIETQSLSRLERGDYEPSLSTTLALARALGLTVEALVLGSRADRLAGLTAGPSPDVNALVEAASGLPKASVRLLVRVAEKFARESDGD